MAVTTSIGPQYVQYSDASSNLDNCIGGGEDYRTLNASTKNIYGGVLAIRGWYGDNISDACKITNIKMYAKLRTRTTYNGATGLKSDCDFEIMTTYGSDGISGNKIAGTLWGHTWKKFGKTISESDNWQTVSEECDMTKDARANHLLPSVRLIFWNGNALSKVRCYVKNVTITATRTRACYITFKGDGITEKTTMYDYGTVPSFGSTPTREGYVFKGWSNGTTTYTGTLPTAYEQDVTYTAVWDKNKVPCTITYNGNGANLGSVSAQSGYVGENLTLASNSFINRACVSLYSNDIDGCEYNDDEDRIDPPLLSEASFLGWYDDREGGTKVGDGGASYTPSGNVTLYAHWSGYPAVTLPTLTREGYAFLGWYDDREGGTKVGDGGESYTPVQSYEPFFAHWEEIVVPPEIMSAAITYGGAQVSAQNKVPAGEGYLIAVGLK